MKLYKKYFNLTQNINVWVLEHNIIDSTVNISNASELAREYANQYGVPFESIVIDTTKTLYPSVNKILFSSLKQLKDTESTVFEEQ